MHVESPSNLPHTVSGFLGLPLYIRQMIYGYTGLVRPCPVDVGNEVQRWTKTMALERNSEICTIEQAQRKQYFVCPYQRKIKDPGYFLEPHIECVCLPFPVTLLRVSRQIYEETSRVLYSANVFKLGPEDLPLLKPRGYARLSSLQIRLTACSCVTGHSCPGLAAFQDLYDCEACHYYCDRGSGSPFSLSSYNDRRLLDQWQVLCRILGAQCGPNLRLMLVCDCENVQTALKIVEPLKFLPTIAKCAIRLGQSPNDELRRLAENAALQVIGSEERLFRFQNLPDELQEMILAYTDLVSPTGLCWNAPRIRDNWRVWPPRKGLCESEDHSLCCMQCTDAMEVCACPVRHAAYTTDACKCWYFPSSIFLVSRRFNHIAKKLFFSRNRFILCDACMDDNPSDREPGPGYKYMVKTTRLLRDLSSPALFYMRRISLSFHSFYSSDALLGTAGHESWKEVTGLIKRRMCTAALLIELDLMPTIPDNATHFDDSKEHRHETWLTFQNIVGLFKLEDGFYKDFFVRLGSPMSYSIKEDTLRWQRERELEKRVMGERYDAAARGKYRDYYIDETAGPRKFWYEQYGKNLCNSLDLEDPAIQNHLLNWTLPDHLNPEYRLYGGHSEAA